LDSLTPLYREALALHGVSSIDTELGPFSGYAVRPISAAPGDMVPQWKGYLVVYDKPEALVLQYEGGFKDGIIEGQGQMQLVAEDVYDG
ncbi:unnamed protein product, partial [Choristocarpus tenellus]